MLIQFDIHGERQIGRELVRVGQYGGDATPQFRAIIRYWQHEIERQFDTQGRHASGGWAPLAESTIADKKARNLDPRILHATLRLRKSWLRKTMGSDTVLMARPHQAVLGSNVPYGRFHQSGTSRMPRRPIELTETARRRTVKMLQTYIMTGKVSEFR